MLVTYRLVIVDNRNANLLNFKKLKKHLSFKLSVMVGSFLYNGQMKWITPQFD